MEQEVDKLIRKGKVKKLIKLFDQKDDTVKSLIINRLYHLSEGGISSIFGKLRETDFVEILIFHFAACDYAARLRIARILLEIDDERAIDPLISTLKKGEDYNYFIDLLAEFKNQKADDALFDILNDSGSSEERKERIVRALGMAGNKKVIPHLIKILKRYKRMSEAFDIAQILSKFDDNKAEEAALSVYAGKHKIAREQSFEWWKLVEKNKAVCDLCNKPLRRKEGYIAFSMVTGITVVGNVVDTSGSPDLVCDSCFESESRREFPKEKFEHWKKAYMNFKTTGRYDV
jgi:hypothetical protein